MAQQVELGYQYHVIGTIALAADGSLALTGDTKTLAWWIARLQGTRSNAEFVATLPQRARSLLWARPLVADRLDGQEEEGTGEGAEGGVADAH